MSNILKLTQKFIHCQFANCFSRSNQKVEKRERYSLETVETKLWMYTVLNDI